MSKGPYKAVSIKDVDVEYLARHFDYQELQVGFDAAKETHFGCLMGPHWESYYLFKFDSRHEMDRMLELLESLPTEEVTCIVEPTGTYSDPLKAELERNGFETRKMRPHKCGQADELFDDVPSIHDGKAAYLVARLDLLELSEKWRDDSDKTRRIRVFLQRMERHEDEANRLTGQMEAHLARFWPELTCYLDLTSASLQELIRVYGGPEAVAADPDGARQLLSSTSRGLLAEKKIEAVVTSAANTTGVVPIEQEVQEMREIAGRMREVDRLIRESKSKLDEETQSDDKDPQTPFGRMCQFGGLKLAAAAIGLLGRPSEYGQAKKYEKGAGLNLKERSSGTHKGELKITKRGPGQLRRYLFLFACRMVSPTGCRYVRAWYRERLRRNGGNRLKGLVAVMRKLIKALYHVGRGADYEPTKLFDINRLDVAASA